PDKMTPDDLQGILAVHLDTPFSGGEVEEKREQLMKRFFAEPYGDEQEGLSQVVDTSVRDVVYWAEPELIDILLGAEKIATFDPVGAEDEEAAEQETDVVNHVALELNPAFLWVYSWVHDALTQVVGYVDVSWEEKTRRTTDRYRGVTEEELTQIIAELEEENDGAEVEVIGQEEYNETVPATDPMTGQPMIDPQTGQPFEIEVPLLDVRLRVHGETTAKPVITPIPPEEISLPERHNSISLETASFIAWTPNLPKSDLIAMGLDREVVEGMAPSERSITTSGNEKETRQRVGENDQTAISTEDPDPGQMALVGFAKCYVRADFDGDGVAELLRVYSTHDGEILEWDAKMKDKVDSVAWPYCIEEVEACGIVAMTPFVVPHRHQGVSLAELLMQSADTMTRYRRNLGDNVALHNAPRRYIDEASETDSTWEDVRESGPAGSNISWNSQQGGQPPMVEPVPDLVSNILAAMDFEDRKREETGISRLQQGLNGEQAGTDTFRGQAQLMDAANKKLRMVARGMAEVGFKKVFELVHMLLRKHANKELAIRLRGEWIDIDPRSWRERTDMTVQIGLGTGNKDLQMMHYSNLWERQAQMMSMGGVKPEHLFNTFEKLVELAGIKAPERFATDPRLEEWQPPEPPQDPLVQIKQIEAQTSQMKMELDAQRIQLEREKMAFQAQMEAAKLAIEESKVELDAAEAGAKVELARDKMRIDAAGKSADLALDIAKTEQASVEKGRDRVAGALAERARAQQSQQQRANGNG
ncbi:MAG: hypothetical protein OEU92_27470, partial [Alphaproteobacteria bacterium]|nr:hypothetical protein [Alphaproteobacteria bacterium]